MPAPSGHSCQLAVQPIMYHISRLLQGSVVFVKKSSHCNGNRSAMTAELLHGHGQFPFPALSRYYGVSEKLIRYKY